MRRPIALAVLCYLLVLNLAAFFIYGWDKRKAKHEQWRVPEHTLLALAFAGGGLGALLGMRVFHHKTRKAKFRWGVPVALLIWVVLLGVVGVQTGMWPF